MKRYTAILSIILALCNIANISADVIIDKPTLGEIGQISDTGNKEDIEKVRALTDEMIDTIFRGSTDNQQVFNWYKCLFDDTYLADHFKEPVTEDSDYAYILSHNMWDNSHQKFLSNMFGSYKEYEYLTPTYQTALLQFNGTNFRVEKDNNKYYTIVKQDTKLYLLDYISYYDRTEIVGATIKQDMFVDNTYTAYYKTPDDRHCIEIKVQVGDSLDIISVKSIDTLNHIKYVDIG